MLYLSYGNENSLCHSPGFFFFSYSSKPQVAILVPLSAETWVTMWGRVSLSSPYPLPYHLHWNVWARNKRHSSEFIFAAWPSLNNTSGVVTDYYQICCPSWLLEQVEQGLMENPTRKVYAALRCSVLRGTVLAFHKHQIHMEILKCIQKKRILWTTAEIYNNNFRNS